MKLINSRLPAGYSHEDIVNDEAKDEDVGGDDDYDSR